jgi:hypothetical protein
MIWYAVALAVFLLLVCGIRKIVLWSEQSKPLTDEEVKLLSSALICNRINDRFRFERGRFSINPAYRASIDAEGRWDHISLPFKKTLSFVSELLRYKRHEWFVWCLADERECKFIWANKGNDNATCYSKIDPIFVATMAKNNGCNIVICVHNHPHTQERYWRLCVPSETDVKTCEKLKVLFYEKGISFIDAVCTQGCFSVYGYRFTDDYFRESEVIAWIQENNGKSRSQNKELRKLLPKNKDCKISL